MSLIHTKRRGRARLWRGLSATLAGLGWLAMSLDCSAQVTVDTIGGGVRAECGPAYGFVGGNTYEQAQFKGPWSCALDANGNLWIADKTNSDIEMASQAGNKGASMTTEIYATSGKSTNYHFFTNVTGVAVDPANNLYVLLPSPPQVYKASLSTESTSLNVLSYLQFTGYPAGAIPSAMAVDGSSNVFIAFTNGVIIRFQMLDTLPPPTYLENYALGASPAVHYIVPSGFNWKPAGLALCANGQLAVSDTLNNAIYYVSTNDYTSNAGPHLVTGGNGAGFSDGIPYYAQFNQPSGLAASADGRLIVCDMMNNRLRVIDVFSNTSTLYGTSSSVWPPTQCSGNPSLYAGWVDGVAGISSTNATGRLPVSVTISPSNTLFVTEAYYSLIREVNNVNFVPVNLSATAPVAVTQGASSLGYTNATWNGTVLAGGEATTYYFEWGTNTGYGNYTTTNVLTTGLTVTQPVSAGVSNLTPGTTYHLQLVAFNGLGASYGGDIAAVTSAESSVVTTEQASNVTANSATLVGMVNPEYSPTLVFFQWGTTTNLGNVTTAVDLTNNLAVMQTVTNTISNLQPGTIYYCQVVANNGGGTIYGNQVLFSTGSPQQPTLSINPSNGYFPNCTNISVSSSVGTVYYTTDGSIPTTNSAEVAMTLLNDGSYAGSIEWCNPQQSLSMLHLLAGSGSSTRLVLGGFPATNYVGFPQALSAGPGGTLYIPVVVELQSNVTIESLQFRVEINPNAGSPPNVTPPTLQPLTASDFVPLPGPAPGNAPVTFVTFPYTTSANGQGLVITAEGGSSGLNMQGSGVVVMLHLTIPDTATFGQSYSMNVLYPSGTSDGLQSVVGLASLPTQTLNVSYTPYMVGDSSPSAGYNAGQFGIKGASNSALEVSLNNADVNNAIYASVGIRVPPNDSDAYNAMDAWPPDSAGHGGDGVIGLLDWETILGRSLGVAIKTGMDTNNYLRYWTNGSGSRQHTLFTNWVAGDPPAPIPGESGAAPQSMGARMLGQMGTPPGTVWYCQASIGSGTIINALPGNICSMPVYVNALPGFSLAGLQFRTIVTSSGGAPAVTTNWFTPAAGLPAPMVLPGLSGNDRIQVWSFGSLAAPLQNSNYLGTVSFQVPPGANPGACYALHFSGVDGAPDFSTKYQLESHAGYVWVMSTVQQPASIISDEWRIAFFGSVSNSLAGDNVDADGDGMSNLQEYLAGTNPTNAQSCLQFSGPSLKPGGVSGLGINWLTAPGKTYVLQSSPALNGANWTSINTNSGDGNYYQCIVTNVGGNAHFYQLYLQP